MNVPVITIDGPSGSGKGTVSAMLAKELDWNLLDSGAIYRVLAFAAEKHAIDKDDIVNLQSLANQLSFTCSKDVPTTIHFEGEDVTTKIRSENCGNLASIISSHTSVRQALLERQRDFCQLPGLVADGRDMGTIVFPNAALKIFLQASIEIRAKRRYLQLKDSGLDVNLESLVAKLQLRDERDKNRATAPLRPASDAVIINTSELGVKEVLTRVLSEVKGRIR